MAPFRDIFKTITSFKAPLWKGLVFGLGWYILPSWLFMPLALYLYFVPFFHSSKFLSVFVAIWGIYFFAPSTFFYAFLGAILFGWLIAIRELLFINRRAMYEGLILIISFFLLRLFYQTANAIGFGLFFSAFIITALIGWMGRGFIDFFLAQEIDIKKKSLVPVAIGIFMFFLWQATAVAFLIPVDFVYQSLLVFLILVGLFDLISGYLFSHTSPQRNLFTITAIFCGLVLLLTAAPFGL